MCISTPLLSISPPKTKKGQKKKKILEKQDQNIGIGLSPFTEILNTKNTPQEKSNPNQPPQKQKDNNKENTHLLLHRYTKIDKAQNE